MGGEGTLPRACIKQQWKENEEREGEPKFNSRLEGGGQGGESHVRLRFFVLRLKTRTLVTLHRFVVFAWRNNRIRKEVPRRIEYLYWQYGLNLCFEDFRSFPSRKPLRFHNTVKS